MGRWGGICRYNHGQIRKWKRERRKCISSKLARRHKKTKKKAEEVRTQRNTTGDGAESGNPAAGPKQFSVGDILDRLRDVDFHGNSVLQ